ncbi:MAG: hypothetical protein LBQ68_09680 [Clostridiales bacterium]|jgi:hypothetical protein|nr:hypothetical protein [Clostridiales bacterium]
MINKCKAALIQAKAEILNFVRDIPSLIGERDTYTLNLRKIKIKADIEKASNAIHDYKST